MCVHIFGLLWCWGRVYIDLVVVKTQLLHLYYFTARILVLKFVNKGVFFEEIQDSHFSWKRAYFGTHIHEFGEKDVIFLCPEFTVKRGFIWDEKSPFYCKKGGSFWTEKSVFYRAKGSFWAEKSVFSAKKGVIFKLENKDEYHFSSEVKTVSTRE